MGDRMLDGVTMLTLVGCLPPGGELSGAGQPGADRVVPVARYLQALHRAGDFCLVGLDAGEPIKY